MRLADYILPMKTISCSEGLIHQRIFYLLEMRV